MERLTAISTGDAGESLASTLPLSIPLSPIRLHNSHLSIVSLFPCDILLTQLQCIRVDATWSSGLLSAGNSAVISLIPFYRNFDSMTGCFKTWSGGTQHLDQLILYPAESQLGDKNAKYAVLN